MGWVGRVVVLKGVFENVQLLVDVDGTLRSEDQVNEIN